jgi:hypothetical protein
VVHIFHGLDYGFEIFSFDGPLHLLLEGVVKAVHLHMAHSCLEVPGGLLRNSLVLVVVHHSVLGHDPSPLEVEEAHPSSSSSKVGVLDFQDVLGHIFREL